MLDFLGFVLDFLVIALLDWTMETAYKKIR
jgi:hypothetical protein